MKRNANKSIFQQKFESEAKGEDEAKEKVEKASKLQRFLEEKLNALNESELAERSLHHLASLRAIQSELKSDTDGTPPENESELAKESFHHLASIRAIQSDTEGTPPEKKNKKRKETFRQRRF